MSARSATAAVMRRGAGAVPKKKTTAERRTERLDRATELASSIAAKQAAVASLGKDVKNERAELDKLCAALGITPGNALDLTGPDGEQLHVSRIQTTSDRIER